MNQDQNPKGDFEDRLLAELRAIVAEREPERDGKAVISPSRWRRAPRLALAGGAVTAVAAAVLVVGAGGNDTPTAYAVTPRDDGDLSVEIRSLGDPEGLQSALAAAGVPADVDYEPGVEECDVAPAQDSKPAPTVELTEAVPTVPAEPAHLTIDPDEVGPGETLQLTAAPAGEGIAVETSVAEVAPLTEAVPAETELTEPIEEDGDDLTCEISAAAAPSVPAEGTSEPGAPAEETGESGRSVEGADEPDTQASR